MTYQSSMTTTLMAYLFQCLREDWLMRLLYRMIAYNAYLIKKQVHLQLITTIVRSWGSILNNGVNFIHFELEYPLVIYNWVSLFR